MPQIEHALAEQPAHPHVAHGFENGVLTMGRAHVDEGRDPAAQPFGGGEAGGRIVAAGTPSDVARCAESVTGKFLREV